MYDDEVKKEGSLYDQDICVPTNFYVVHVICKQCSILLNKENQILLWVNCNHSIVRITNLVTKFNIVLSKYPQRGHRMLQCPFISTIVFKDPY